MKLRDYCLDVVAYFGIGLILILGTRAEWKQGQKALAIISLIVAGFMIWEGTENLIHHCKSNGLLFNNNNNNSNTGSTTNNTNQ